MKLTYWVCIIKNDSSAYNIREKTKQAAAAKRAEYHDPLNYTEPYKVTVDYADALDLVCKCLTEGGAYWEREP